MTQDMKLRLADFKVEQARPKLNKMGIGNVLFTLIQTTL